MAIESSDITLISGELSGVVTAISLSRATMRNIYQNLVFAFGYNSVGIPIAVGLLYPLFGILLSPMIAALAMALSSLSVVTNANRLRTYQRPALAQVRAGQPEVRTRIEVASPDLLEGKEEVGMASRRVKDVVCGMEIDPRNAAARMDYHDMSYYFCSPACHGKFMADPERYANTKNSGA